MIFLFAAARYFSDSSGLSEAYWSHAGGFVRGFVPLYMRAEGGRKAGRKGGNFTQEFEIVF